MMMTLLAWMPVYTRFKHPDFGLLCKHIEPNLGWWYEKSFQNEMCAEVKSGWTACWRENCSKGGGARCYLILKKLVTFQVMKTSCAFYAMERRTFSGSTTTFWYLTSSKLNISTPNMCRFLCAQKHRMDQSWPNTIVIVLNRWPWFLLLVPHIYLWRKVVCFVLFHSYEIHQTGMLQIVFLVSLESSWWGGVHGLGSITFELMVQKFLNTP
jgi:hypothetical protein